MRRCGEAGPRSARWRSPAARCRATRSGDVETLSSLANHAAIAIENHRLEAELRQLAVQHERERIAREIHDGLAQLLGYVNTKSQAVEGLLAAGRLDEAMVQMAELSAAARSNYVDVREAIQGLSEPVGAEVDLGAEVRHYADRFAEASKLVVSVASRARARDRRGSRPPSATRSSGRSARP